MLNLEDYYDEIPLALHYFNQGNFEKAIEIYSTILDATNPDEETVPYLYLQYANALIKNANQYFTDEIVNIDKGYDLNRRREIEDDIENAWNVLEQSKLCFTILKDDASLAKTHFLLGEISLLNNDFSTSIQDYVECINLYNKIQSEPSEYYDVYLSMGSAYEFVEDYVKANKYYHECVNLMGEECEDLVMKIQENKFKMENPKEVEKVSVEVNDDDGVVRDINCNKKRVN